MKQRAKWLSQELQGFQHIKVLMLDETGIPTYPYGWSEWSGRLKQLVPEEFEVIFGGEPEYQQYNDIYLPDITYELFDFKRERYPISATEIRNNPLKYWDYILGSARYFFAKKVLIAGTESCGKSTITRYLAKIYHTAWSEEEGRYYAERFLGSNDDTFTLEDFGRIASQQYETDMLALKSANKVVFYDSDAVITQYYAELYLGEQSPLVEKFIDPHRYDVVLLFTPDVKWVADGQRFISEDARRWALHKKLKQMYIDHGFGSKLVEISGNYNERLIKSTKIVDDLLEIRQHTPSILDTMR